jgi:hypothetical protein
MVGNPGLPPRGTKDADILLWCELNNLILVTNNRSSIPVHLADHLSQGRRIKRIFVLRPKAHIGEIIENLIFIALAAEKNEFLDQIIHNPLR